jgi:hypothetical protein
LESISFRVTESSWTDTFIPYSGGGDGWPHWALQFGVGVGVGVVTGGNVVVGGVPPLGLSLPPQEERAAASAQAATAERMKAFLLMRIVLYE